MSVECSFSMIPGRRRRKRVFNVVRVLALNIPRSRRRRGGFNVG